MRLPCWRATASGYTNTMDPVRFGRALGVGARAAAKTVVAAVDAANAPNPAPENRSSRPAAARAPQAAVIRAAQAGAVRASQSRQAGRTDAATATTSAAKGVREGARRFGREVWNPFVRVSGVLWLEFTGVFFGIFALFALGAAWKLRRAWHVTPTNASEHQRLLGAIAMLALFGYFTVSSFLRASRRGRTG